MRIDKYLSVWMFQLNMTLDCNSTDEYLIETDRMEEQLKKAFQMMQNNQADITLFPEMAYMTKSEETYQAFSKPNKIVVAGSYYKDGINRTVVFQNGTKFEILKGYASYRENCHQQRQSAFMASLSFQKP